MKSDLERIRPFYKQNAASQLDLDNAIAAYETANYGLESKEMGDFFKSPIHYLSAHLLGPLFAMGKNRAILKAQKAAYQLLRCSNQSYFAGFCSRSTITFIEVSR